MSWSGEFDINVLDDYNNKDVLNYFELKELKEVLDKCNFNSKFNYESDCINYLTNYGEIDLRQIYKEYIEAKLYEIN